MGSYGHGYDAILSDVEKLTGLDFEIFNSGGGCMIFEARAEGGLFVWVTDADAGVTPLDRRHELEAQGIAVGCQVSVYPAFTDPQRAAEVCGGQPDEYGPESEYDWPNWCDSDRMLASVVHHTATAEKMPELVKLALLSVPDNAQHVFDRIDYVRTCGCRRSCPHGQWDAMRHDGVHDVSYGVREF